MLATYAADEVGQRWGVDYVVNTPHFFKQIAGWIFFLFNKKENVLSLPHTVCEGPLLLVSMGVMLLSKGTWYGTTAQAGGRPAGARRAPRAPRAPAHFSAGARPRTLLVGGADCHWQCHYPTRTPSRSRSLIGSDHDSEQ